MFVHVAEHVYCVRHITENVARHLTDSGVDASAKKQVMTLLKRCTDVSADISVLCDDAVRQLTEHASVHHSHVSDYFREHVVPKVRHNMQGFISYHIYSCRLIYMYRYLYLYGSEAK